MPLPESAIVLGCFVDAFEARRGSGPKAAFLRDRTGRRALSGRGRARHWCCLLRAFIDCLLEKRVVVTANAPKEASTFLFFSFASAMKTWDLVAPHATAPLRAHLRFFALDLAAKLVSLHRAGFDFGMHWWCDAPAWTSRARRSEPLELFRMSGTDSRELARRLECQEHTVGAWFSKGVRPNEEHLELLADELAERGFGTTETLRRWLFVHYSLSDLLSALGQVSSMSEATDAACVARALIVCASHKPPGDPRVDLAMSLTTPSLSWVESAQRHGASEDWVEDYHLAKRDYERAGVIESGAEVAVPEAQLLRVISKIPLRHDACAEHRRMRRKFLAELEKN